MKRWTHITRFTILAILVLALATTAIGQTTTATVRGRVMNENGEGIAGVDIVATNVASGFTNRSPTRLPDPKSEGLNTTSGSTVTRMVALSGSGSSEIV